MIIDCYCHNERLTLIFIDLSFLNIDGWDGKEQQELESAGTGQLQSSCSVLTPLHRIMVFPSLLLSGHLLAQMDSFGCGSESRV